MLSFKNNIVYLSVLLCLLCFTIYSQASDKINDEKSHEKKSDTLKKDAKKKSSKNKSDDKKSDTSVSKTELTSGTLSFDQSKKQKIKKDDSWVTITGNIKYKDIYIGKGKSPKKSDYITMHLIGTLEDGTEFFNTHRDKLPFNFYYENNEVIKGIEIGIADMKEMGKRIISVPPEYAYGEQGYKDGTVEIKPNSTLIFEISLIKIKDPEFNKVNMFR